MTALLSIITFCLIVLIIFAGIGVFNLRCICNYCDFIHSEQYHHQGILNSINTILSQIQINQAQDNNQIIDHLKAVFDSIKVATISLEDIKANTAYEPDDFTIDDDLPFPEDEPKDEPTTEKDEREHFILTEDTTADEIIEAYKKEVIAIHCADEDEWKESVDFVSSLGVTTNDKQAPNACKEIGYGDVVGCKKFVNCHAIQSIGFPLCIVMEIEGLKAKNNFVQGNIDDMEEHYDILEWSDIRELFIISPTETTEQTDEEYEPAEVAKFVEETVEPHLPVNPEAVVEQPATEIPEEISTVEDAERYLDEQRAAETAEKASEDIPAAPVESDTEDKGEADA